MALFELEGGVDRSRPIQPDDIRQTKQVLRDLGYYQVPAHGITDFTDDEMFEGIESFQRDRKLKADGTITQDGETERALKTELVKRERERAGPQQVPNRQTQGPFTLGLTRDSELRNAGGTFSGGFGNDSPAGGGPDRLTGRALTEPEKALEQNKSSASDERQKLEAAAQGVFARLSRDGFKADPVRRKYGELLEAASRKFAEEAAEVSNKPSSIREIAKAASKARSEHLKGIRDDSTRLVRAIAELKKRETIRSSITKKNTPARSWAQDRKQSILDGTQSRN